MFLDWFGLSCGVITLRPVLMYYVVNIVSPLFILGSFSVVSGIFSPSFWLVLDVDISSLFIVGEAPHRV
jgi:hypothetical protein